VPPGVELNIGKVGPFSPGGQKALPGGADQILLPENYPDTWISTIIDNETGTSYTVPEFKSKFPELFKAIQ